MLLTLQQGWRGLELRDFLTSQACVQHVEWDALRYPGAGSPTPPSDTPSGIPLDTPIKTPSDTASGSVEAASRARAAKRLGRKSGAAGAGDTSQTSQTAAQRRAKGGKSSKPRRKAGPGRGKGSAKREGAEGSTPPAPQLASTVTEDARSEPVQRQANGATDSPSNQRTEL